MLLRVAWRCQACSSAHQSRLPASRAVHDLLLMKVFCDAILATERHDVSPEFQPSAPRRYLCYVGPRLCNIPFCGINSMCQRLRPERRGFSRPVRANYVRLHFSIAGGK